MRFPLLLIKNHKQAYPELITAPWQLGQPGLDVLQKRDIWVGSNCYMDGSHSRILGVSSKRKGGFLESLLHRSKPAYWNVQVEMTILLPGGNRTILCQQRVPLEEVLVSGDVPLVYSGETVATG